MSAHTPGPWVIGGIDGDLWVSGADQTKAVICDIVSRDGRWCEPEDEANAALIAAAPDLLEACKIALESAESDVDPQEAIDALYAAIAKAEGRAP